MKKISIIIAVYNIEKYISKCLESVIKQKGNDIEIIIIDDGSTDNSLKICKSYQKKDKRIKIITGKNKGLNAVRNIGFDNSTGEYIWHIDGDDYIKDNSIEIIRNYIDKYDIIYFNYNRIENNIILKEKYEKNYDSLGDKYILGIPGVWNKIFKREILKDERFPNNCSYNDFYIIPALIYKTDNIIFISDYLYNYVYRSNSLSHTRKFNLEDLLYCFDHIYNKLYNRYPDAVECFYVNQLLFYSYGKEIRYGNKYDYKNINKEIKKRFPKYYLNKYYNRNIFMKIYIRLIYYDRILLVKLITYVKFKIINKYIKR